MKKFLPILLCLCTALYGCGKQEPQAQLPTDAPADDLIQIESMPDPTEESAVEEPDYQQQPMYAISLPINTEETANGSSTFAYQNMQLVCQDQEVADRIIVDFLNRQDAQRNFSDRNENAEYEIYYQPKRLDSGVLSLYGESVLYQVGNRPIVACHTANYSMLTGEVLSLGSILRDSDAHGKLEDALLFAAETTADEKKLYNEYPQIIADRFARNAGYDEAWYFTSNGLCFFFEPYEIAPYASGIVTFEIPYDQLLEILDDAYFPLEEDQSEGKLVAAAIDEIDLNDYSQIAEAFINGYTDGCFLYCDGLIRDIRITIENENRITGISVFAGEALSPGDGIMLMFQQPESTLQLSIAYRSGQTICNQNLLIDSNGNITLP